MSAGQGANLLTSPVPGFTAPSPRTWSQGDFITTPRLRGDVTNFAYLYAGGARPMFLAFSGVAGVTVAASTNTPIEFVQASLNSWNVAALAAPAEFYSIPMAGFWLVQGTVLYSGYTGAGGNRFAMGFDLNLNGTGLSTDGGCLPASTAVPSFVGVTGCELFQFNTEANTGDIFGLYAYTDNTSGPAAGGFWMAEWVGLPTSGLTSYTGPYGTLATPVAAASFPSGPGATITNGGGITAGATAMTVSDATGMIAGGTLGLDVIAGQYYQPFAESVSITSVAGTTIGISAASYAHAQGAPVAVPNSAAFLNQQVRDQINYLAYPPLLKAQTTTTQSIASGTFPAGTQITNLSATYANWSGFASNTYTAPHSGTYLVYGQVYYAGTGAGSFTFSAGLQQNSGTIQWGTRPRCNTSGAEAMCATVRRVLRLSAGDTIKLYGFQDSGSAMNTVAAGSQFSKLICVWRSL